MEVHRPPVLEGLADWQATFFEMCMIFAAQLANAQIADCQRLAMA
jgi:hypothetical protein